MEKIQNNEDKQEKLSNRTWRILERQLESPNVVNKIENCSRANANRVNFGRTGPSGEIGVRKRLRKWLRRSSDLEEINFEMMHDKDYGGRSWRNKGNMDVMHGSAPRAQVTKEVSHIKGSNGIFENAKSLEGEGHEHGDVGGVEGNLQLHTGGGNAEGVGGGSVLALSKEQISQHPLELKMMQRLEALEERQSPTTMDQNNVSFDVVGSFGGRKGVHEIEEDGGNEGREEDIIPGTWEWQNKRRRQG